MTEIAVRTFGLFVLIFALLFGLGCVCIEAVEWLGKQSRRWTTRWTRGG